MKALKYYAHNGESYPPEGINGDVLNVHQLCQSSSYRIAALHTSAEQNRDSVPCQGTPEDSRPLPTTPKRCNWCYQYGSTSEKDGYGV